MAARDRRTRRTSRTRSTAARPIRRDARTGRTTGQQEQPDGDEVVPVLGGEAARAAPRRAQVVEMAVARDAARDLEAGRAQQADAFADLPVDRDQDLRREQAVVAGPALRGIGDVVPEEVVRPDRRPGHPEGGARVVGVDDRQPAGDTPFRCRPSQVGVVVLDLAAEVRPGLHHRGELVPDAAQVVDDVGAVPEETGEELAVGHPCDRTVHPVVEAVQGIDPVRA